MAFLPARFCAEYPDFALTDCGNPRPGAVLVGFLGVRRRSDRDKPVVVDGFFLFSVGKPGVLSTGICGHPVGCAVGLGNLSVRFFMHIHRTAGGRVFLLQCPDSRSAGGAYGFAYRAFQHSFPQAVKKAGKVHSLFHTVWKTGGVFDNGAVGSGVFPLASPATEPKRHWLSLPLWYPAGGVLSLSPADFAFSLIFCPHPPAPLPSGKGETLRLFYARGFAPCIPGAEPGRHLQNLPLCFPVRGFAPCGTGMGGVPVPGGGRGGFGRPPAFYFSFVSAPIPPPPFPAGRGRLKVFLCKGLRPLHPRG